MAESSSSNGAESKGPKIRLPREDNRITLIGQTGTGKTVAGLWHLSNMDLERPWVVVDSKGDDHIKLIKHARLIDFDFIPRKNDHGLFILRPLPMDMKPQPGARRSAMEEYLWKIHARGGCGVFFDELFMLGDNEALDAIYTQGRSLEIPVIGNTQRPAWVTRYAFSEASFLQCFDLIDQRDIKVIEGFMPLNWDEEIPLAEHNSFYYDIGKKQLTRWRPVPNEKRILKIFEQKLYRKWVLL